MVELNEKETTTSKLDIDLLQQLLDTQLFGSGKRLLFFPTVDSTNVQAMQMARHGVEEGVVLLTDSQTAGKGRLGRRWFDRYGENALLSIILAPFFPPHLLVMMASLALVDAIAETCNVTATIKWPNDVLIDDHKIAGILIETSRSQRGQMVAIVGVGVNVNGHISQFVGPELEPLQTIATTLETVCGHEVSREALIARLLYHLEVMYLALQQEAQAPVAAAYGTTSRLLRERWRNRLSTLGRAIQVRQGNNVLSGIAEDVNESGELWLRTHSGERISVTWGDIGYPTT